MPSIIGDIVSWISERPYWEQAAFQKLIVGSRIDEIDLQELTDLLLEDAGLREIDQERMPFQFNQTTREDVRSGPMRLRLMSNLININALVEGQTLTFSPNITAVFGRNGSGKSGYARVLGCAGFSRGDKQVLPDVSRDTESDQPLSAKIVLIDGTNEHSITYEVGRPCPELSSLYVFDSTSVLVHLTDSNTFSFAPAGLFLLTELAKVTDMVRDALSKEIENRSQPHNLIQLFPEESWVRKYIEILGAGCSEEILFQVGTLTEDEIDEIEHLDQAIAILKARDVSGEISKIDQRLLDLEGLKQKIEFIGTAISDESISEVNQVVANVNNHLASLTEISKSKFTIEGINEIGFVEWINFITAAHSYGSLFEHVDEKYPSEDSICLLCEQPLSTVAREHILGLWRFLESEIQSNLEEARSQLEAHKITFKELDLAVYDERMAAYRDLEGSNPELHSTVLSYLEWCDTRIDLILGIIQERDLPTEIPPEGVPPSEPLNEFIELLKNEREKYINEQVNVKIEQLEYDLLCLRQRRLVGENLDPLAQFIRDADWAKGASEIGVPQGTSHLNIKACFNKS